MIDKRIKRYIAAVAALLLAGCSVTRHVPDGSYLLTKNNIVTDKQAPKQDRITADELERYVRQSPNNRFFGTNFYLGLYSMSNPANPAWFHRTLRSLGAAPVLLDTSLVRRSADNLSNYLTARGYYHSQNSYRIDTARKKAKVTYFIKQNEPYLIRGVDYDYQDEGLRAVILQDSASTLLKAGAKMDHDVIRAEQSRIIGNLKNNGYYYFSANNIAREASILEDSSHVDLTLTIKQHLRGYDNMGFPQYENNRVYRLDSIFINPGYDPSLAASDPGYFLSMDTTGYRGLNILYHDRPNVRRKILRHTVGLQQNGLYSEAEVKQAYSDIMRLGYYKNVSILFDDVTDYSQPNLVTFVGDDGRTSIVSEGYLKCLINCIPAYRHSYKIELEGTTSSNFNGLTTTLGYQNRNLFRGAEMFDITFRGGYEFSKGVKGAAWEMGGVVSLSLPRFITPINPDPYNKSVNPRTKIELSINSQDRKLYERTIFGGTWSYNWSNRRAGSFSVRPIDVNLIKVGFLDPAIFGEGTPNPFLENSYKSQLVAGISGWYAYNSQLRPQGGTWTLRVNGETAGNLIGGLTHLMGERYHDTETDSKYYRLFGIRYAQYFRADISFSDKIIFGPRTNIAYRIYAGGGMPYGNSSAIPFDRLFYSGGSNSMRGWVARTLGPGNSPVADERYPFQMGNIKLEANVEFRFPMWNLLNGAVFFDLGNIWLDGRDNNDPLSNFGFDSFYRQLGFNTGLGLRLDINVAILRLDWGIKLHNPNMPAGQRWFEKFRYKDTVLNFGVGYPF